MPDASPGPATSTATAGRIERTDLLVRLRRAAQRPLVALVAGAGYGKSTLAAQWADRDPRPHRMVRVGRFMDDPASLALQLVEALESLGADAGTTRGVVTGAEPRFSALALPALGRLAARPPRAYVLVVDDVHLLTDPDCHAVLQAVSDGVPPGSQLALLSRTAMPAWVARARAEGRLMELGQTDLAFGQGEARDLLHRLGIAPDDPRVDDLVARSEGWPVGLYLMALAAAGNRGARVNPVAPTGSDRYLLDYVRGEVLSELPQRTREFLRRTSIVEDLDVHLCDAIVHRQDSARVLADLARRLQLVLPTDAAGQHYRYHHLLSDALRVDLTEQEPWLEPRLHARASAWYEAQGDRDRAIRHARAADDLPGVSRLVWAGVPGCIASGHPDRLRSWLDLLDEGRIRSDPWLTLSAAWFGLQTGDQVRMTRWLLAADEHAGPGWRRRVGSEPYPASLASIHITVGDLGLDGTIELCHGVQRGLPRDSPFRAAAFLNEGVALILTRRRSEGLDSLREGAQLARALGVAVVEANALAWEALVALLDGDWAHGAPFAVRAGELVRTHRLDRLATAAHIMSVLALLQASRGEKSEARLTLGTARRLTGQASRIAPWFAVAGPLVQARVAILLDEGGLARTLCAEARSHMRPEFGDTLLGDFLGTTEALLREVRSDGIAPGALTRAELRVLQFLPSRLTFPQIGEHLFISQNTVKTHAVGIYRKLGASSRNEAVERARQLGLIESPPDT